jgi:hypothetical protein
MRGGGASPRNDFRSSPSDILSNWNPTVSLQLSGVAVPDPSDPLAVATRVASDSHVRRKSRPAKSGFGLGDGHPLKGDCAAQNGDRRISPDKISRGNLRS